MSLWLFRAGKNGEYEKRFLDDNRVYITWGLDEDLAKLKDKAALRTLLQKTYPDAPVGKISNNTGQVWAAIHEMKKGDWVVTPSKLKPSAIHVAEVLGPYSYDATAEGDFRHSLSVKWIATDIPRSVFDQDVLYSFGAIMTICQIKRNDAEARIRAMAQAGWKSAGLPKVVVPDDFEVDGDEVDLERLARDQIAKVIIQKYKGHGLSRLVEAILKAQGYTTYLSPEGPDKGIDILAAPGPLGFGTPRICVQVKSGDAPVDSPTLNQLIGSMQNVQAAQGLLVSWGGFKSSVDKEIPAQFFRVRLWDQDDLINALLADYDKLDEDFRAEIPLKRIWTVASIEVES